MACAHDIDSPRLGWREAGDGTLVLLLHGLGGSRIAWEPQMAALSDRHRVIAWDMPGYGSSSPIDGQLTWAALADAAAALLTELAGANSQAHVVGLSLGGMIAQHLAARHGHRVRSLILMSTSPAFGLDGTDPAAWRAARNAPLDAGLRPADFAEESLRSIAAAGIAPDALHAQCAAMARIEPEALRRVVELLVTHDTRHLLGSIAAPTLVVVGELDHETPVAYAQELADGIPGARLAVVPGAGHLVNAEAPETVNRLIADHLDATEAGG